MDERVLAERLVTYDTSTADGLRAAAGFVKGWLQARDIDVVEREFEGLPVLTADVGPAEGPTIIFHGHLDIVPAHPEQFVPVVDGDRLYGRGAYDMKGGLAAMMCALRDVADQDRVRVRFLCVPDEESEEIDARSTDMLVASGVSGDFAITGEPTDLHVGVQAKGVLACLIRVAGRSAHGSTPWMGDNAVLKAVDVFRRIESLPFSRESSDMFDRPSINLGRIHGGDRFNKVPDDCTMAVDIRYLPGQEPEAILAAIAQIADCQVVKTLVREPAYVSRRDPYVRSLCRSAGRFVEGESVSVGRDGASDVISFQRVGIPAVEFGPSGGGHHGPEEWVSITSLARYRRALGDFVRHLPVWLQGEDAGEAAERPALRVVARGGGA